MQSVLVLVISVLIVAGPGVWFNDVTKESGIPPLKYAEGVYIQDLNGDGLPELFLPCVKGKDRLFKSKNGMRFEDVTGQSGLTEKNGIGAVIGDFNGDGLSDLYVVRGAYPYGLNVLYLGEKDGKFRDATGEAGVAGKKNGIAASACDLDGDGRLDIFVSNWGGGTFYKNTSTAGKVSFVDATKQAGLSDEGDAWGSVIADFNGDALPDLLVVRGAFGKYQEPKLFINKGGGEFRDGTAGSGIRGVGWSMGAAAADFDGDGSLDLLITNYDGPDRILFGDGRGHFTDGTAASGISSGHSIGVAAGDIDGDLRPDIVIAGYKGPVRLYKNIGGRRFEEIKDSGLGPDKKNEGVALADVDGDGALDLYVANYDGGNRLYRNTLGGGNFIKVRFETIDANTAGAAVRLYKAGGIGKREELLASETLFAGSGFCSQSPQELVFRQPDGGPYDIAVTMPGGKVIERRGVPPGTLRVSASDAREETISGSVTVKDALVVPAGARVRVMKGAELRFAQGAGVKVNGTLVSDGASFLPLQEDMFWDGIDIMPGGRIEFTDTEIADASGVTAEAGSLNISGGRLSACVDGILLGSGANAGITGLKVTGIKRAGILLHQGSKADISGTAFSGPGNAGIVVNQNSTASISKCTFDGLKYGIIAMDPGKGVIVSGSSFTGNEKGAITESPGNETGFTGCSFRGNETGLCADRFSVPVIESCKFNENKYGLYVDRGAAPSVAGSDITGNEFGVYVTRTSYPVVGMSRIFGNSKYSVYLDKQSVEWLNSDDSIRLNAMKERLKQAGLPADEKKEGLQQGVRRLNPKGGYVDFQHNYWGPQATKDMLPEGLTDVPAIYDFFDDPKVNTEKGALTRDKVDYSGYLLTDPLANTDTGEKGGGR